MTLVSDSIDPDGRVGFVLSLIDSAELVGFRVLSQPLHDWRHPHVHLIMIMIINLWEDDFLPNLRFENGPPSVSGNLLITVGVTAGGHQLPLPNTLHRPVLRTFSYHKGRVQ